jgi:hypothetical protein
MALRSPLDRPHVGARLDPYDLRHDLCDHRRDRWHSSDEACRCGKPHRGSELRFRLRSSRSTGHVRDGCLQARRLRRRRHRRRRFGCRRARRGRRRFHDGLGRLLERWVGDLDVGWSGLSIGCGRRHRRRGSLGSGCRLSGRRRVRRRRDLGRPFGGRRVDDLCRSSRGRLGRRFGVLTRRAGLRRLLRRRSLGRSILGDGFVARRRRLRDRLPLLRRSLIDTGLFGRGRRSLLCDVVGALLGRALGGWIR